jgi:hypothetical protein
MSCLIKIRPVGAELFLADGQTDMTKLIVAFRNFANAHKTVKKIMLVYSHFSLLCFLLPSKIPIYIILYVRLLYFDLVYIFTRHDNWISPHVSL